MKCDTFGEASDYMEPVRKLDPMVYLLRKRRYEQGLSQPALAMRMGYDVKSLKTWEAGVTMPKLHTVAVWAEALGMELKIVEKA